MKEKRGAGRPRAEDASHKLSAILVAAQQEFVEYGFRAASMRRVAERAEVSTRTLYNRYPDKLVLFEACLESNSAALQIEIPDSSGTLRARLIFYAAEIQRQMLQENVMQVARLLYREEAEFEELQRLARVNYYRYQVAPVERILAANVDNEQLRSELATHFVALALAPWQRCVVFNDKRPGKGERQRHAEVVTDLFLRGVGEELGLE
jgi:AcrR family transcriptional regulator